MKNLFVVALFVLVAVPVWGSEGMARKVSFDGLKNGAVVKNPVTVCIGAVGVEVEPASKGVNPHKGHHHILVDVDLPKDLSQAIPKDENHIHMGDGSACKDISLSPGKHTLRLLFANGTHIPMESVASDTVEITVEE